MPERKKKLKLTRKLKELGYKSRKSFMLFGRLNNRVETGVGGGGAEFRFSVALKQYLMY